MSEILTAEYLLSRRGRIILLVADVVVAVDVAPDPIPDEVIFKPSDAGKKKGVLVPIVEIDSRDAKEAQKVREAVSAVKNGGER